MVRIHTGVAFLLLVPSLFSNSLPERADRIVSYQISVRLDPNSKQLDGKERIVWRNPSNESVPDLWFHLYLNAFKNTKTTFFRESGGELRGDTFAEGKWGWTQVKSLRLGDGTDLTGRMAFVHPDDDNVDDQTVMRVALPQPVPAGHSLTLELTFLAQLPQVYARSGYRHDYFLVGQWFPKLGVYEPAGRRGRKVAGWNCHQYHANSEFYADYGEFKVDITVPAPFVVGATGVQTARRDNSDKTVTYTHEQADVHDFAWTASPRFREVRQMFKAAEQVSRDEYARTAALVGRSLDEVKLSDVEVILLMQPNHMDQLERHLKAVMSAIKYYGLWYGRYPYRTITVVDPGPGASGSAGMEYPTFITAGTSFLLSYWPFVGARLPELVTVHEFGHQFWYAMVGNNEFEEAWLDEGINSYSTGRVTELVYGKEATLLNLPGLRMGEVDSIRLQNSPNARFNSIISYAWNYTPPGAYGFYSYTKPELALRTLENYLGEPVMAKVMRTFQERWRFRHPSSEDFFAAANEVSGSDLGWFFDPVFRGTDITDYEIGSLSSEKAAAPYGMFDRNGLVEVKRGDEEKASLDAKDKGGAPLYDTVVVVRRRGEIRFPVEVEFKFEGRPPERSLWDGKDSTKTYRFTRTERLEWANLDPDRKVLLDVDWLNNARRLKGDGRASAKWGATWMFWAQNLLALIGL